MARCNPHQCLGRQAHMGSTESCCYWRRKAGPRRTRHLDLESFPGPLDLDSGPNAKGHGNALTRPEDRIVATISVYVGGNNRVFVSSKSSPGLARQNSRSCSLFVWNAVLL